MTEEQLTYELANLREAHGYFHKLSKEKQQYIVKLLTEYEGPTGKELVEEAIRAIHLDD
jgi:hypothetical protein|tara:strand:+ start:589 stop:765 length:177 start_codon:yes stop_codon:yes gene_type:complete